MLVLLCSVAVVVAAFAPCVTQGAVFTSQQTDDVVHFVTSLTQCRGIVGLTLAVVRGNETWTRGFGLADRERGRKVSPSDLFGIGSLTKTFTSALISLYLNDTARYSWTTPVVDILGKDFGLATEELTLQTTLKDLLTHRTGLETAGLSIVAGSSLTMPQFVRNIRHLPIKTPFRDEWDYNNWMYSLAGHVAEVLGGAPWEDLVRTRLLQPLGMTQSRATLEKALSGKEDLVAKAYITMGGETVLSDPDVYRITPQDPAGAMASSAEDMAKWMLLFLNKGRTQQGRQLLSEAHLTAMTSPHVAIPPAVRAGMEPANTHVTHMWKNLMKPQFPVTFATDSYGFAWFTATYRGYPVIWHSGSIWAYTSFLGFIPHVNLAVFISTNGPNSRNAALILRQTFLHIADLIMGEDPWINITNACRYPQPWQQPPSPPPEEVSNTTTVCEDHEFDHLDRYIGRYEHPLFDIVDVVKNGSQGLYAKYGLLEGRLCKTDSEAVVLFEVVGKLAFAFRPGSRPTYLQLNFSRPLDDGGVFQEVVLDVASSTSRVLVFHRGTPSSASGCGIRGGVNGILSAAWLLVFVRLCFHVS